MMSAIQIAKAEYAKKARELEEAGDKRTLNFELDLADYLNNGIVCASPAYFLMAKAVDIGEKGKPRFVWYTRYAVGPLPTLLSLFPFPLPEIAFGRRWEERRRILSMRRMIQLARARSNK